MSQTNHSRDYSSGSSGRVRGPRNMKSVRPLSGAIFFMTNFYRVWGAWPPRSPATGLDGPLDENSDRFGAQIHNVVTRRYPWGVGLNTLLPQLLLDQLFIFRGRAILEYPRLKVLSSGQLFIFSGRGVFLTTQE